MLMIDTHLTRFRLLLICLFALFVSNAFAQNTIFTNQVPGNFGNDGDYELGTKFTSSQIAEITAIRFYMAPGEKGAVVHTGKIWSSTNKTTPLATAEFTNETASGWQTAVLSTPLKIDPETEYVVSVNIKSYYAATESGLSTTVTNGILSTVAGNNGVFNDAQGVFPEASWNNSNYFVDVIASPLNSIFTTQVPPLTNGEFTDGPYELGVKFQSSMLAKVRYIKYYRTSGETAPLHTGNLWQVNGTKITSANFETETSTGWQYAAISTPVYISPLTTYVVSVNSNAAYAAEGSGLATSVTNGVLSTIADGNNGVYSTDPNTKGVFPTASFGNTNYFRDIVVVPIYPATLISPANNANGVSIDPVLSWSPVIDAQSYTLQIATDQAITQNVKSYTTTSTTYSLTGLSNSTTYYWRVTAINPSFPANYNSAVFNFKTIQKIDVVLSWPTGGAVVYTSDASLSWYVSSGGTGWKYDLLYSNNSDMSSPTVVSNLSSNMYTLKDLQPGTDYYWQIKLKTSSGAVVSTSAIGKFVTSGSKKPLQPVISWPKGNPTVYTLSPTLYWYLNGAGTGLKYEVEIKPETVPFNESSLNQNISDLSYTVATALLPNTKYHWRVRSISGTITSDWSEPASFTTLQTATVAKPIPSYPIGEAIIYTTTPTLYWYINSAATGLTYEIEWVNGRMSQFSGNPQITKISSLSTKLTGPESGNYIKWRVRSVLDETHKSDWSDTAKFMVNGPAVIEPPIPTATWPIGDAKVYTSSVQLSWYLKTAAPAGLTFDVEYTTGNLTGNPSLNCTGITDLYKVITQLQAGQTYKWSVRSTLGTAHSAWITPALIFTTVNTAPVATKPVLAWPTGGTTVYTNSTTLSWYLTTASTGVTYILKYSTSQAGLSSAPAIAVNSTQYVLNNLTPGATYYWTVQSKYDNVTSEPSATGIFTVFAGSSAVAAIAGSPVGGVQIEASSPIVLSWFIPTQGDVESYEVQYSKNPDMTQATSSTVKSTSMAIKADGGTNYFWRVRSKNSKGETSAYSDMESFVTSSATGVEKAEKTVTTFNLKQNYPNPFNPSTTIEFDIPVAGQYSIKVYNMLGQEVATLLNGDISAGVHEINFDASKLTSGTYIYRLSGNNVLMIKKMVFMK